MLDDILGEVIAEGVFHLFAKIVRFIGYYTGKSLIYIGSLGHVRVQRVHEQRTPRRPHFYRERGKRFVHEHAAIAIGAFFWLVVSVGALVAWLAD